MEKNAIAIIKSLTEELESAINEVEMWKGIYRKEKERADKAEAAQNERHDA